MSYLYLLLNWNGCCCSILHSKFLWQGFLHWIHAQPWRWYIYITEIGDWHNGWECRLHSGDQCWRDDSDGNGFIRNTSRGWNSFPPRAASYTEQLWKQRKGHSHLHHWRRDNFCHRWKFHQSSKLRHVPGVPLHYHCGWCRLRVLCCIYGWSHWLSTESVSTSRLWGRHHNHRDSLPIDWYSSGSTNVNDHISNCWSKHHEWWIYTQPVADSPYLKCRWPNWN